jgi:hypothetical protein
MGHSIQMLLSTYVHVIEELRGRERISAEAEIREARAAIASEDVAHPLPPITPARGAPSTEPAEESAEQAIAGKPTPGLEPGTPSLRVKCSTS